MGKELLAPPVLPKKNHGLTAEAIQSELQNNLQGLLGYVVRWVQLGVGCSKVPDLHGVDLMEDKATLRISSQHVANWLAHGVVTRDQVMATFSRMIDFVNEQNRGQEGYRPMTGPDCLEAKAALELIFEGERTKNGYTEAILHKYRRLVKKQQAQNTRARSPPSKM